MGRNDRMKMARIGSWFVCAATSCTPNRCVASPEGGQQQQHQADETEDMNEVAHPVWAQDAEYPRDQQNECDLEQHLASGLQPSVPRGECIAAAIP
jgi:hypothetical protein